LRAMEEIIKADVLFYVNQKRKIRIYVAVAHYRCPKISARGDYLLINLPKRGTLFFHIPRLLCIRHIHSRTQHKLCNLKFADCQLL